MGRSRHAEIARVPTRAELRYTDPYTEDFLEAQRQVADPIADDVIRALRERFPARSPDDTLREVRRLAESEGGIYARFVDACCHVPRWADFAAMREGMRLMASASPVMGLSILGIVAGSAWHVRAEPVFTGTGRFVVERGVAQRLKETSAILWLCALSGAVQPGGRHHAITMKVRLLHASVRAHALSMQGEHAFDTKRWGMPINQEDLAYAQLLFSYLNIRGMLRLGLTLSDEQIVSLRLLWRWVGHVVGVLPHWQHESVEDEMVMYRAILKHLARPGEASVAALNLLDGGLLAVPAPARPFVRRMVHAMTADLGGAEYLEALGLSETGSSAGYAALKGFVRAWNFLLQVPGGEPLLHYLHVRGFERTYGAELGVHDRHGYALEVLSRQEIANAMSSRAAQVERLRRSA